MKDTVIFDTNMILRYLLDDNAEMADLAEQYLNTRHVIVTIEVIAEVVYVLQGVYSLGREQIVNVAIDFLDLVECKDESVLRLALYTYGKQNMDFVDCVLYGYNKCNGIEVATFDKKLIKLLNN